MFHVENVCHCYFLLKKHFQFHNINVILENFTIIGMHFIDIL